MITKDTELIAFFCGNEARCVVYVVGTADNARAHSQLKRETQDTGCPHDHITIRATWNQLASRRGATKHNLRDDYSVEPIINAWYREMPSVVPSTLIVVNHYEPRSNLDPSVFEEANV